MMGYGPDPGFAHVFGGLLGGFMILAFWALVIVGIVLLVKSLSGPRHAGGSNQPMSAPPATPVGPAVSVAGHDEAVAIAKRRLASGEITPAEYEEIMRVLSA